MPTFGLRFRGLIILHKIRTGTKKPVFFFILNFLIIIFIKIVLAVPGFIVHGYISSIMETREELI